MSDVVRFTVRGEPAAKANQREIVKFGDRLAVIKSKKARTYERDAVRQIPSAARLRLTGPVRVTLRIYYASERPDLDESVLLDVMQDRYKGTGDARVLVQAGVYRNDRQVREKHVFWGLDRINPRCDVTVEAMQAQQCDLELDEATGALPF